jgi:hypothetical protein
VVYFGGFFAKLGYFAGFKSAFFVLLPGLTLLDMGGGFLAPPFFKGQIVKKTLRVKKSKKMSIPLFMSLLCMLCFDFYQNRLICMQNEFEKTCSARDWDGKDYLRIIPRVVW